MNKPADVLDYHGRPCEIVGGMGRRKSPNPKWGWITFRIVRFLDGEQPAKMEVTTGRLAKAKKMRETERLLWRRVDELIKSGMEKGRAKAQASAEAAKGVLDFEKPF